MSQEAEPTQGTEEGAQISEPSAPKQKTKKSVSWSDDVEVDAYVQKPQFFTGGKLISTRTSRKSRMVPEEIYKKESEEKKAAADLKKEKIRKEEKKQERKEKRDNIEKNLASKRVLCRLLLLCNVQINQKGRYYPTSWNECIINPECSHLSNDDIPKVQEDAENFTLEIDVELLEAYERHVKEHHGEQVDAWQSKIIKMIRKQRSNARKTLEEEKGVVK